MKIPEKIGNVETSYIMIAVGLVFVALLIYVLAQVFMEEPQPTLPDLKKEKTSLEVTREQLDVSEKIIQKKLTDSLVNEAVKREKADEQLREVQEQKLEVERKIAKVDGEIAIAESIRNSNISNVSSDDAERARCSAYPDSEGCNSNSNVR